jgi:hypothetical protein
MRFMFIVVYLSHDMMVEAFVGTCGTSIATDHENERRQVPERIQAN